MDFELDGISQEFGHEVEERLNARLAENVPVHVHFLPRAEALADTDLIRTKVSLIPESVDPIRVIDIVGIDKQADGGTHVAMSGEVGRVRVVRRSRRARPTSASGSSSRTRSRRSIGHPGAVPSWR
ncbi:MAG: hypothetical protein H0X05_01505 [Actinobacteria bacterium]|nr:hypothetical protein [Actinomycetota bacterium]